MSESNGRHIGLTDRLEDFRTQEPTPLVATLPLRFGDVRLEFPAIAADEIESVGDWLALMLSVMKRTVKE